ncbi:MAG: hypothetical protein QOH97_5173 [Actinoplanes sp.]|nr:hypothetical protein [Actinoplanes sp.]
MQRTAADDANARGMSDVSVTGAGQPSTSGAHWANRDNENIYRRTGSPYRRPNAVNSFPDDAEPAEPESVPNSWWRSADSAVSPASVSPATPGPEPAEQNDLPGRSVEQSAFEPPPTEQSAFGSTGQSAFGSTGQPAFGSTEPPAFEPPAFGPAPPMSSGRASFGVSAGPIGGYRPGYGPAPVGPEGHIPTHGSPADGGTDSAHGGADSAYSGDPGFGSGAAPTSPPPPPKPLVPAVTGHTGDIFRGPARKIRPHRAVKQNASGHVAFKQPTPEGTPTTVPSPAPAPAAKRSRGVAAFVLGGVVLLAVAAGGMAYFTGADKDLSKLLDFGAATNQDRSVTAPLGGRTTAGFEMLAASHQVTVKTQDLGENLYKITTADDSGMIPSPAISADRVQLILTPKGDGGNGDVTIVLSAKVLWSLRFTGGSDEQLIDLTGGQISEVNLVGGARRVELTLPKPTGTVPVNITAGLDELLVNSTAKAPVRVTVQAGAKTVAAGTRTLHNVAPGSTLTPKNWRVEDRYDLDAKSWLTLLSVDPEN